MRQIEIDIDVFAAIWARRLNGEANENQILKRILLIDFQQTLDAGTNAAKQLAPSFSDASKEVKTSGSQTSTERRGMEMEIGKIRWVDDVQFALKNLGGHASLQAIYKHVEKRRCDGGRSLPRTLEAVIRRTLEDHSSDSQNYKGNDLFTILGRGEWGLR